MPSTSTLIGIALGAPMSCGLIYALIRLYVAHKLNTRENTRYRLADMGDLPRIPEGMAATREIAGGGTATRSGLGRTNDVRTRHGSAN